MLVLAGRDQTNPRELDVRNNVSNEASWRGIRFYFNQAHQARMVWDDAVACRIFQFHWVQWPSSSNREESWTAAFPFGGCKDCRDVKKMWECAFRLT